MKNLLVVLSIALLATGTALAAGTATVKGPASVDPGQLFEVTIDIQADEGMLGWQVNEINATGGALLGPWTGADNAAKLAYHYANTSEWDTTTAGVLSAWVTDTTLPVGPVGSTTNNFDTGSGSGTVFRLSIIAPMTPDSFFDVFLGFSKYTSFSTFGDVVMETAPLTVYVTPEPLSALLLLAGLPMLRRRR